MQLKQLKEVKFAHGRYETSFDIDLVSKIRSELLFNIYYKLFEVVHADTPALRAEAHKIRFQVFCIENQGYEDPSAHPDGMEKDSFDHNAEHTLLIYKPTGKPIGTARIIRHNEKDWRKSFPLQGLCSSHYLHDETYVKNSCEFSRFCISQEMRNHIKREIKEISSGILPSNQAHDFKFYEKPLLNVGLAIAPMGIIRGAFELTMRQGLLNIFGIMEPRHIKRLENIGLLYEQIGPEMEYHGTRVPFICNVLEIYEHALINHHDAWSIMSVKGQNHKRALEVYESLSMKASQLVEQA